MPKAREAAGTPEAFRTEQGGWHARRVAEYEKRAQPVNRMDADGKTPLFVASAEGRAEGGGGVRQLLTHPDIDVNQAADNGKTPLFVASTKGHAGIVRLLLTHPDIDVDLGRRYVSPLLEAMVKGHADVERLLTEAGAGW